MAGMALLSLGEIEHGAPNDPAAANPDVLHQAPVGVLLVVPEVSLAAFNRGAAFAAARRCVTSTKGFRSALHAVPEG